MCWHGGGLRHGGAAPLLWVPYARRAGFRASLLDRFYASGVLRVVRRGRGVVTVDLATMAFPTPAQLQDVLDPLLAQFACQIEGIKIAKAGAKSSVRIAVDSRDPRAARPDLDAIEEITREVSRIFDEAEEAGSLNFGPGYTLEVSTPGVDAPLTQARHFERNIGRAVALPDGSTARIAQVATVVGGAGSDSAGAQVALLPMSSGKGGAQASKKRSSGALRIVELAEVSGAMVEIEFSPALASDMEWVDRPWAEYVAQAELGHGHR